VGLLVFRVASNASRRKMGFNAFTLPKKHKAVSDSIIKIRFESTSRLSRFPFL